MLCSGSLLSPNKVLTAGHCCPFSPGRKVVAGEHNRNVDEGTEQIANVSHVKPHRWFEFRWPMGFPVWNACIMHQFEMNQYDQLLSFPSQLIKNFQDMLMSVDGALWQKRDRFLMYFRLSKFQSTASRSVLMIIPIFSKKPTWFVLVPDPSILAI